MGNNREIIPAFGHIQITTCCTGTTALRRYGTVHWPKPLLLIAIQVISTWITGLYTGLDHGMEQFIIAIFRCCDRNWSRITMIIIAANIARFSFFIIRQTFGIAPVF